MSGGDQFRLIIGLKTTSNTISSVWQRHSKFWAKSGGVQLRYNLKCLQTPYPLGLNDNIPNGYIKADQNCDEKGDCQCFIPCKNIWKTL